MLPLGLDLGPDNKCSTISAISPGLADILSPATEKEMETLSKLDLGMLFQWMLCFCIVKFDLSTGHGIFFVIIALEHSYPPIPFSEEERKTLCFSAFPDSNSNGHSGDTVFSFRMRNGTFTQNLYLKHAVLDEDDQFDTGKSSGIPIDTDGFTYGHVFFRQQKDDQIKRGFFQKALVLLTPHPWHGLFSTIIAIFGPKVMESLVEDRKIDAENACGVSNITNSLLLQNACFEIASWPSPPFSWTSELCFESMKLELSFFGSLHTFSFPPNNNFPQLYPLKTRNQTIEQFKLLNAHLCNPGKFYQAFRSSFDSLWQIWESVVMGEPIYILADTPNSSSQIVQALVELIKPIPFGGDYRPYFTIQDSDFDSLTSKNRSPPQAIILGVTNQYFSKVLQHWPNYMSTTREKKERFESGILNLNMSGFEDDISPVNSCKFRQKPFFTRDKKFLKSIIEVGVNVKGVEAINNMIRKYFQELSQMFLQPLNRYFDSLVMGSPGDMSLSKLRPYPEIRPFRQADFLKAIEISVPIFPCASKRPITDLYRAYLKSPNFASWLAQKTKSAYRNWRNHYLNLLANSDIEYYVEIRISDSLIECVDLLMRLREEITRYSSFFIVKGESVVHSFSSAVPKQQPVFDDVKYSQELEPANSTPGELFYFEDGDLNPHEEVDLTNISSFKIKNHIKACTAPSMNESTRNSRANSLCHSPRGSIHSLASNLETLMPKKGSKTLTGIGDFIPSAGQYKNLLLQLQLLNRLLPQELTRK